MRITTPVDVAFTTIPHRRGGTRPVDGLYLVVVSLDDEAVAMMAAVLHVTNAEGHGFEFSQSLDGTEFLARRLQNEGSRPGTRGPETYRFPTRPNTVKVDDLFEDLSVAVFAAYAPDGRFTLVVRDGYAFEMSARGNLVCPHCGRRHQLGGALKADEPCLCGQILPELAIPFVIPPIIGTTPSTPL